MKLLITLSLFALVLTANDVESTEPAAQFNLVGVWDVNQNECSIFILDCREDGYCVNHHRNHMGEPWKIGNVGKFERLSESRFGLKFYSKFTRSQFGPGFILFRESQISFSLNNEGKWIRKIESDSSTTSRSDRTITHKTIEDMPYAKCAKEVVVNNDSTEPEAIILEFERRRRASKFLKRLFAKPSDTEFDDYNRRIGKACYLPERNKTKKSISNCAETIWSAYDLDRDGKIFAWEISYASLYIGGELLSGLEDAWARGVREPQELREIWTSINTGISIGVLFSDTVEKTNEPITDKGWLYNEIKQAKLAVMADLLITNFVERKSLIPE